jgi:hypothetical protein
MWNRPHLIALDEPTNYIDKETLKALVRSAHPLYAHSAHVPRQLPHIDGGNWKASARPPR